VPIKAAVTTSDAWPHLAGIREYVARGIPMYALDLNLPILKRMIEAPHTSFPDLRAKSPRTPKFQAVTGKTVVGGGDNRFEIYPMRGETSERQMMINSTSIACCTAAILFRSPARVTSIHKPRGNSFVERETLAVDIFFMMHIGPTPWSELGRVIATMRETWAGN